MNPPAASGLTWPEGTCPPGGVPGRSGGRRRDRRGHRPACCAGRPPPRRPAPP